MKQIKIGFIDSYPSLFDFTVTTLSKRFQVVFDNDNPDYLFFGDENFGVNNLSFDKPCTRILFTQENRRPENYRCNYAISYDHNFNPWHFRLPLYITEMFSLNMSFPETYGLNYINEIPKHPAPFEREFCAFVHRNGGPGLRNAVFHYISQNYKHVDSAGTLFNNTGITLDGSKEKIEWLRTKKFTLCFENGSSPGYVTEKLLHAFYANSLPIYWGSGTIDLDFNPEAFIDAGRMNNVEELIEKIKYLDTNEQAYMHMLNQPPVKYGFPVYDIFVENFLNWFESVVYQKKNMRVL